MTTSLAEALVAAVAAMEARGHVVELSGQHATRGWHLVVSCTRCGGAVGYVGDGRPPLDGRELWPLVVAPCD